MKISGINSFYYYEYNNKKYYFFGDLHGYNDGCDEYCDYYNYTFTEVVSYNNNCTDIAALLHNWFNYNNKNEIKTDFYLEDSFTKSNIDRRTKFKEAMIQRHHNPYNAFKTIFPYTNASYLELLQDLLQPCLVPDKTSCPYYPNVHVHYTDIRAIDDIRVSPFNLKFLYGASKQDIVNTIRTLVYHFDDLLLGILDLNYHNMITILKHIKLSSPVKIKYDLLLLKLDELTVIRQDVKMHRVAWSLYNHPDIKDFILTLCHNEFKNLNYTKELVKIKDDLTLDLFLQKYINLFTIINAYIFDAYLLSRMFNQDGEEIVVYAGAAHIEVCALYFQTLGLDPIYMVPAQKKKCITIPLGLIDLDLYRQ